MYSLDKALDLLIEETMPKVYERHKKVAYKIRTKLIEIGFELFPDDENHAGQGNLSDKILRIGHLGLVSDAEIDWLIESLIKSMEKENE